MRIISQLVSGALALCLATAAFGVENEAPVRLRLALDEQGRVHLSTEPLQQVAPSLYPARQPSLAGLGSARVPTAAGTAIDFTMSSATGSVACSPAAVGLARFGVAGDCDPFGYGGLPGAVQRGDLALEIGVDHRYGLGLSYGLDWLDASLNSHGTARWLDLGDLQSANPAAFLPGWIGPVTGAGPMKTERFGLGGFVWLGPDFRIDLNYEQIQGAIALLSTDPLQAALLPWESAQQDSLSLGMNYGRLHGALTGRQLRPNTPMAGRASDSLDLGFSWRMPWNAAVEFGARNLIVRPKKAEGGEGDVDEGDLRVPYLRYHQEL